MKEEKLLVSGAIAGAATPYLLRYVIMPILNFLGQYVPAFSMKLANPSIAINIRESLTGINAGLAGYLMDTFGITVPASMWMTALVSAAGGAILFYVGNLVAEQFDLLKGNAMKKTTVLIFTGNLAAGLLLGLVAIPKALSLEVGINTLNVLLAFAVNAVLLSYAYSLIDKEAKIGLVPY